MLQFFYSHDYRAPTTVPMTTSDNSASPMTDDIDYRLVFEVKMCGIADKYFNEPLKKLAETKFRVRVASGVVKTDELIAAVEAIVMRKHGNADALRQAMSDAIYADAAGFIEAAKEVDSKVTDMLGMGFELLVTKMKQPVKPEQHVTVTCGSSHHYSPIWQGQLSNLDVGYCPGITCNNHTSSMVYITATDGTR